MSFPKGPFPRTRKTIGILALVTGVAIWSCQFVFHRHLTQSSPREPTPLTGQIVQEGKGPPHYFITTAEDRLETMLFGLGIVLVALGVRLCGWMEPTAPPPRRRSLNPP
jgi:hypothetical protein